MRESTSQNYPVDESWLRARREIVEASNQCRVVGLQTGNGGNLSQRLPGQTLMAVKATDASFADRDIAAATIADFLGNAVEGMPKASKEGLLHGSIYARLDEVGAVAHCHSPWAVAWAQNHDTLPLVTYHSGLKLKSAPQVFDTGGYAVSAEWVDPILEYLVSEEKPAGFILRGHGTVAVGKDLRSAVETAELLEETAQVAILGALLKA